MAWLEVKILLMALGCVMAHRFFDSSSLSQTPSIRKAAEGYCSALSNGYENNEPEAVLDALGNLSNLALDIGPRTINLFKLEPLARGYSLTVRTIVAGDQDFRFISGVRSSLERRQIFIGNTKIYGPMVVPGLTLDDIPRYDELRRAERPIEGFVFPVKFYHPLLPFSRLANRHSCTIVSRLLAEISRQESLLTTQEVLLLPPILSCWEKGRGTHPIVQLRRSVVDNLVVYYPELFIRTTGWVRPPTSLKWSLSIQTKQTLGREVFALKFGDEVAPVEADGLGINELVVAEPNKIEDF